jgi:isopenicillin N synthase-like dioxygenase
MSFDTVPILDLSHARSPSTKQSFLDDLRHALLEVGFLYIKNTGIPEALIQDVMTRGKAFFDLPMEKKLEIEMKNAKSFLGYSKLGMEITRFKTDWREQIDMSTPHPVPGPDEPLYRNLLAPNQWPDPEALPGFRETYEEYMAKMGAVSIEFTSLCAEAIGLPANAFDQFFDEAQQHKLKIIKYPDLEELGVEGQYAFELPTTSVAPPWLAGAELGRGMGGLSADRWYVCRGDWAGDGGVDAGRLSEYDTSCIESGEGFGPEVQHSILPGREL